MIPGCRIDPDFWQQKSALVAPQLVAPVLVQVPVAQLAVAVEIRAAAVARRSTNFDAGIVVYKGRLQG